MESEKKRGVYYRLPPDLLFWLKETARQEQRTETVVVERILRSAMVGSSNQNQLFPPKKKGAKKPKGVKP